MSLTFISVNIISIHLLNHIKAPKVDFMFGCIDLYHTSRFDYSMDMTNESTIAQKSKGDISEGQNVKDFLGQILNQFVVNKKDEMITILSIIFAMQYKVQGNIREHLGNV